jgi:hypothetical protein
VTRRPPESHDGGNGDAHEALRLVRVDAYGREERPEHQRSPECQASDREQDGDDGKPERSPPVLLRRRALHGRVIGWPSGVIDPVRRTLAASAPSCSTPSPCRSPGRCSRACRSVDLRSDRGGSGVASHAMTGGLGAVTRNPYCSLEPGSRREHSETGREIRVNPLYLPHTPRESGSPDPWHVPRPARTGPPSQSPAGRPRRSAAPSTRPISTSQRTRRTTTPS